MNGICAMFIQYCTTIYPTGLCDEQKQPHPQGVSCSINRVLPASKSVKMEIIDPPLCIFCKISGESIKHIFGRMMWFHCGLLSKVCSRFLPGNSWWGQRLSQPSPHSNLDLKSNSFKINVKYTVVYYTIFFW